MAINHRPHCSAHKKLRKKERGTFWKPNPILNSRLLQAPGMANRRFDGYHLLLVSDNLRTRQSREADIVWCLHVRFTGSDIDQLIQNRTGKSLYLKKFIFLQGRTLLQVRHYSPACCTLFLFILIGRNLPTVGCQIQFCVEFQKSRFLFCCPTNQTVFHFTISLNDVQF